jgi:hypothetical protein
MSKINEEHLNIFRRNIEEWYTDFNNNIKSCIDNLVKQDNIKDIMKYKELLLDRIMRKLPIQGAECFYCIQHDMENKCNKCDFGKKNGICDKDDSLWRKMKDKANDYISLLEKYWKV